MYIILIIYICKKLLMFLQHVTIATRGDNTVHRVYANRHPHLSSSDLLFVMYVSEFCPVSENGKSTQKAIRVWPTTTDWQMLREQVM